MSELVTTGDLLKHLRGVAKERDELLADMRYLLENYMSQDYGDCDLANKMRKKWGVK